MPSRQDLTSWRPRPSPFAHATHQQRQDDTNKSKMTAEGRGQSDTSDRTAPNDIPLECAGIVDDRSNDKMRAGNLEDNAPKTTDRPILSDFRALAFTDRLLQKPSLVVI